MGPPLTSRRAQDPELSADGDLAPEHLHTLFNHSPDAQLLWDPRADRLRAVSDKACSL